MNFSDLRSILQYVPQFRGRTFVVALDGSVIDSRDFSNILLDIAVLRSLNIKVVLVHGAAAQIEALGSKRNVPLSNLDGTGTTDEATLEVSMDAITRLSNSVMQSLTTVKLKAATANAIHAHPAGIIKGIDTGFTGTIEKIDSSVLQSFLDQDILPVVPPLGFDADGQTLRVNSDAVAREVATALAEVLDDVGVHRARWRQRFQRLGPLAMEFLESISSVVAPKTRSCPSFSATKGSAS